jgi:hypothetical protein
MNGGNVQIYYYVTPGPAALATGYGIGGYGSGGYGTGVPPPTRTGTPITVVDYTLDNWGETLVACQDKGPIFVWNPSSGLRNGQLIPTAPIINTGVFVSMPLQIMIAYGISVLGVQDPLLLGWCTSGDYTVWTAAVSNLAGTYRIPRGSMIVGGMQGPQYGLIWTDIELWQMSYIGYPAVFGFNSLAAGCGLIAKFAYVILGTTVFWMSQKGFFALPAGGGVTPLPCEVWDVIFQNLDTNNLSKIRAAANSQFQEVAWYFPSINGNGENDTYVKFTPQFNAWDYGSLGRTAWIDQSIFGPPIGASSGTNYIYQHETSNDADGVAIQASFETGWFALAEGEDVVFCDLVQPDMRFGFLGQAQSASVQITMSYANYAQDTVYTNGSFTMQSGTPNFINVRFRGRLASIKISSDDLGTFWRLGGLRVRTALDGRL